MAFSNIAAVLTREAEDTASSGDGVGVGDGVATGEAPGDGVAAGDGLGEGAGVVVHPASNARHKMTDNNKGLIFISILLANMNTVIEIIASIYEINAKKRLSKTDSLCRKDD
jgi:hypothetical protein